MDTFCNRIHSKQYLTFDDVLLVPSYSTILPHQVNTATRLTRNILLNIPLVSAAMDTVTGVNMAAFMADLGGIGIVHKNQPIVEQAAMVLAVKHSAYGCETPSLDINGQLLCGAAIGTGDDSFDRAVALVTAGVDVLVVDTAHGHSAGVGDMVGRLKDRWSHVQVIAGNVATAAAAHYLAKRGADAIKTGIGPGSICSTRIVAGIGVPQFTAIMECADAAAEYDIPIIADGGIRTSGDIVKALAAGASSIMIGSLLAGTDQAPGDSVTQGGQSYKQYRGMGSVEAMVLGSKDRYGQSSVIDSKKLVAEGVAGLVRSTGSLDAVVHQLVGGLRSGMGYTGSATIKDLWSAQFVKITQAGVRESNVHDITEIRK